jgi:hypothetical protein
MPSLRLGEAAGQFSDVPGADQLARSGVTTWRHRPVIASRLAAPDPPPRVLAPEPVKFGIQAPPAWPGVHGRGRPAVQAASAPLTSPGMTSPAGGSERPGRDGRSAMQLPPSSRDLGFRRAQSLGHPGAPGSGAAPAQLPRLGNLAASRGGRSGAGASRAPRRPRPGARGSTGHGPGPPRRKVEGPGLGAGPRTGRNAYPAKRLTCRIRYNAPATTSAASVMWRPPAVTGRNAGSPSTRVRIDGRPSHQRPDCPVRCAGTGMFACQGRLGHWVAGMFNPDQGKVLGKGCAGGIRSSPGCGPGVFAAGITV